MFSARTTYSPGPSVVTVAGVVEKPASLLSTSTVAGPTNLMRSASVHSLGSALPRDSETVASPALKVRVPRDTQPAAGMFWSIWTVVGPPTLFIWYSACESRLRVPPAGSIGSIQARTS